MWLTVYYSLCVHLYWSVAGKHSSFRLVVVRVVSWSQCMYICMLPWPWYTVCTIGHTYIICRRMYVCCDCMYTNAYYIYYIYTHIRINLLSNCPGLKQMDHVQKLIRQISCVISLLSSLLVCTYVCIYVHIMCMCMYVCVVFCVCVCVCVCVCACV